MRFIPLLVSLLLANLVLPPALRAQSARWEPSGGTLAIGQNNQLQLVFEDCSPKGQPSMPAIEGLSLQFSANSSQTSIINGKVSQSEILVYAARPSKRAEVTIPSFTIETDKGRISVPPAQFSVGEARVSGGASLESIASSSFKTPVSVWAGEVFPIEYNLNIRKRNIYSLDGLLGSLLEWKPTPLIVEEWSKPAARETQLGNDAFISVYQNTRAFIGKPGQITLPEGSQLVNITTGSAGLGFFNRPNLEQFAITSNKPAIQVLPLPAGAPASFNGAVGQFSLQSNVVPESTAVGEPVTWTLTLSGTGNWPGFSGLPARSVSRDFRTVQPQAKRTPKDESLFDATLVEDVVLIPTKPGVYTLGPVTWTYFDPAKGEYKTVTTTPVTVNVAPAAAPAASPVAPATNSSVTAGTPPKPPAMPKGIPRDPLPEKGESALPIDRDDFVLLLGLPGAFVLCFWLGLALQRARLKDPARPRREARSRLSATIRALQDAASPAAVPALLMAWQQDAAKLFEIQAAVPTATDFPSDASPWRSLWEESDRVLYREETRLPSDWSIRAASALQELRVPGFSFWQMFRPGNILPFAAALVLAISLNGPALHADEGQSAYARGDFAGAESHWRKALVQTPACPSVRHNLSLAIAQQDRWAESAAHAAAAFAQAPADPAIRWNLAYTFEKSGFAPSVFSGFAAAHPPHRVAGLLSPAHWQQVAVLASIVAAMATALVLLRAYGRRSSWLKRGAIAAYALSLMLGAASAFSLRVYSPLDDSRAVLVWRNATLRSIPTEADTTQKTTSLPAGTVAVADRHFIGKTWSRLSFPNGQTGWVRTEDLVGIWRQ